MKNAKRALALLLALILALPLCLSGCGEKDAGPLRICVDVGGRGKFSRGSSPSAVFENLLKNMADYGGPEDVEVDYIPKEGADRESVIKHLKTELMSGSGPDLFIVDAFDGNFYNDQPVFPIPEQLIERRVFLPLDEYIEKAQFAQWDRLTPKVMEAGRGSEGQILVPLAYTLPLTCYKAEDYQHTPSAELTWQDMLDDGSGMLRQAGCFGRPGSPMWDNTANIFTRLADYKEEQLLFTEEELLEAVEQQLTLWGECKDGEWDELPTCYQGNMSSNFMPANYQLGMTSMDTLSAQTPMTMVPMYNKEGGITAKVSTFAAINRNSKKADEAFFVLDYLLGKDAMEHSDFYVWIVRLSDTVVMDMDIGKEGHRFRNTNLPCPENQEQFDRLRECITSVSFANLLDHEMDMVYTDSLSVLYDDAGDGATEYADLPTLETCSPEAREKIKKIVSEGYRIMDAELQES